MLLSIHHSPLLLATYNLQLAGVSQVDTLLEAQYDAGLLTKDDDAVERARSYKYKWLAL
tara:strand:- start:72 stop:248 length:177 start_codon:yes stop_codon:yes gene_type:complete